MAVFAGPDHDDELDGVEVGGYDDFDDLRKAVCVHLESGSWGSRFPTLMNHRDSRGEWSPAEAARLALELEAIESEMRSRSARPLEEGTWQAEVARVAGIVPGSIADSFFDIDGEPLLRRLRELALLATERECDITFQ